MGQGVAAMRRGQKVLAMPALPAHRTPEPACGPQGGDVLRVHAVLHAEAAADVRGRDLHSFQRDVEHRFGQVTPDAVHALAAQQQREGLRRRVVFGQRAAVLQGGDDDPVVDQVQRHHVGGGGHCGGHRGAVALLEAERQVARHAVPHQRGAGCQRVGRLHHAGQGIVVHAHKLGRIPRRVRRLGDDEGDRLADVARAVGRQGEAGRHAHRPVGRRHGGRAGDRPQPGQVGGGEHARHARQRPRRRRVDAAQLGVGVLRAHHVQDQRPGAGRIRHVASGASQEAPVLQPPDALAHQTHHPRPP